MDALGAAFEFGQVVPNLVTGEAEDGGELAGHGVSNAPENSLRAAAGVGVRCGGVEAVFDDVKVKRAEVSGAEFVGLVVDAMELELFIPIDYAGA